MKGNHILHRRIFQTGALANITKRLYLFTGHLCYVFSALCCQWHFPCVLMLLGYLKPLQLQLQQQKLHLVKAAEENTKSDAVVVSQLIGGLPWPKSKSPTACSHGIAFCINSPPVWHIFSSIYIHSFPYFPCLPLGVSEVHWSHFSCHRTLDRLPVHHRRKLFIFILIFWGVKLQK